MSETDTNFYEPEDPYEQLLIYMKQLFKRSNIVNNTYLYKKMNGSLSVPLYIIAQQRNVASISRNYQDIIDAIQNSGLAHVIKGKQVKIIQYPTVKINMKSHEGLRALQQRLTQKQKKYEISKRLDTQQFINLTVFGENIVWLEKQIQNIDKQIQYQKANLMSDIQFGVDRIRRLKFQHAKQKTEVGKVKYSLNNPPQVFVRKALESSESEAQETPDVKDKPKEKSGQRRYKYNQNRQKKPRLNAQDFPNLK